jgi:hypothetical protein
MKSEPRQRQKEQEAAGQLPGPAEPRDRRQIGSRRGVMHRMCRSRPVQGLGGAALDRFHTIFGGPDLVVLDIMLPRKELRR